MRLITVSFFDQIQESTVAERAYLNAAPLIADSLNGRITLQQYVAYLCQAYHHVKHTVPLLMATGSRLSESHEWLRDALAE